MTQRASSFVAEITLTIERSTTSGYVQAVVREFVRAHGGSTRDEWSIAIAASEASTNIAKFATTGTLSLRVIAGPPRLFELVAEDDGPGFNDPESARRDHLSEGVDLTTVEPRPRRRGLGTGLGAIERAMGTLRIEHRAGGGARLIGRRRAGS